MPLADPQKESTNPGCESNPGPNFPANLKLPGGGSHLSAASARPSHWLGCCGRQWRREAGVKDAVHTPRAQTRISSGRRRAQGGRIAAVGSRLRTGKGTRQVNAAGGSKRVKKSPALTSSLAPSPGGVLAADVFHKVQNDKKPRNQSQVHSNPVMLPFLFSFFF